MKNIAVIGATGSTGKEVVRLALDTIDKVTVIVRNPDSVQQKENLTIVKGDVTNIESFKTAFQNVDAVISCFGPANGRKAGNIMSVGVKNIVCACEESGVNRFVFMSGILQADDSELTFFNRLGVRFIRLFYKEAYKDKIIAENIIQNCSLDWVIVRAVGLSDSEPTRTYKAGIKRKVAPFTPLSYTDFALALLHALEDKQWSRQIINVGKK